MSELPQPLDAGLRQHIGYNIKRAYLLIQDRVIEVLSEFQLRPTSFAALTIIADNPNLTQSQLADALRIKRSGVVLIVDDLEGNELIARHSVQGDRRSYALRATIKGMQVKEKASKAVETAEMALFTHLSPEQCTLLKTLFQGMTPADESDLKVEQMK